MFYSQLYSSIQQVYRECSAHHYGTLCVSLPILFLSMTTAYGSTLERDNVSKTSSKPDVLTLIAGGTAGHDNAGDDLYSHDTYSRDDGYGNNTLGIGVSGTDTGDANATKPIDTTSANSSLYNSNNSNNLNNSHTTPPTSAGLRQQLTNSQALAESFEEDSVQRSLERLAQFYQLSQADLSEGMTDVLLNNGAANSTTSLDSNADSDYGDDYELGLDNQPSGEPLPNEQLSDELNDNLHLSVPTLAPKLFYQRSADASAYRCEGVWTMPKTTQSDSAYRQAIERAQRDDQLDTSDGLPLYTQADYAYYDSLAYLELSGNVELIQQGQLVNAERIVLDLDTGIASAQGDVVLANAAPKQKADTNLEGLGNPNINANDTASSKRTISTDIIAVADSLAYDTNSTHTTAHDVAFASIPMQAHGYAKKLNKPDDTHLELEKVMFSTCPPTDRKWQIEADAIDIDTDTGRGQSYNTTFRLGKVPIFYLPYFDFPVDDRRSSGLLTPNASFSTESGLQVSLPYYLNLAPHYDATVTADIFTNRNPMLTGELRYLTDGLGEGNLKATFLPNDKQYDGRNRHGLFYQHSWNPAEMPKLSADVVYNYVSDPEYLNDFDGFGLSDSSINLPRRAQVNYYNDNVNAQLKVETFQSLKAKDADGNLVQDKDKPYSRLPQLSVDYRLPSLYNIAVTGIHDSAYFKKSIKDDSENEKSGVRIYNGIAASYPIERSWGYLTPKVNLQHLFTAYDEESRIVNEVSIKDNSKTVFVPQFSLDSALKFYQAGSPLGLFDQTLGGYQLFTLRLKYTYAPYQNQDEVPNFDTRTASFDYDQLFADSRFLGYDRIPDNNSVALGMNYRYIDAMGVTRFDGSIGDQFYLDDIEVSLNSAWQPSTANSSGVAWRSSLQPYRNLWLDFNGALNSDYELNFVSSQLRYQPTPLSLINFGIIERKEDTLTNQSALSALTASTIIPFDNNWRLMAQGQFDNNSNKFIDSTVGIGFEDCCYGLSVYARSYYNDLDLDDKPTRAVMAELRINGLGDSSSRFSRLLSDKILGFEPVEQLWKK